MQTSARRWPERGHCASCSRRSSRRSLLSTILVLNVKFQPEDLRCRLVAELWLYPDDSRILELSTKCAPAESFQVATEVRVFLTREGVDLSGEQETKTRKALEFFSNRLKQAPA